MVSMTIGGPTSLNSLGVPSTVGLGRYPEPTQWGAAGALYTGITTTGTDRYVARWDGMSIQNLLRFIVTKNGGAIAVILCIPRGIFRK